MIQVQHSVIDPAALLGVIKRQYPEIGARECRILALNCNDNFFIKGKRRDFVFRLNRKDWWPRKDFEEELRLLEYLKRRKINVVVPRRNRHNKRFIAIKTAEGTRYGALFGYIAGKHMSFTPGPRNCNMVRLGQLAAQLHDAADQLQPPVQRWTMSFDFLVTENVDALAPVLAHREKDMTYLQGLADRLQGLLDAVPDGSLDFGYCHGDLHTANVMLSPDGGLTLIDFDWSGYCWRLYDLATLWWTLRNDKAKPQWRAVLRGYTSVRPLSRQAKAMLPAFVMIREFELLGFHLMMRKHIGEAWLDDNYYDHHMRFIKDWVKEKMK